MSPMSLLQIRNLTVEFGPKERPFAAVQGLDLDVERGEFLGIVGESGSGKSVAMLALMGLVEAPGRVTADLLRFDGQDLLKLSARERRRITGRDIAMIFQDPMTSLDPSYTVGFQIIETLKVHQGGPKAQLRERALELLRLVEMPDAEARLGAYPHQLSGGMCQRVMIALALACRPSLLIADEPTTGLDVTTQAAIMALIKDKTRAMGMSMLLITHDLGLTREQCDRIVVMHAGHMVEAAPTEVLFTAPQHPYTRQLIGATPVGRAALDELTAIPGNLPDLRRTDLPSCRFAERCALRSAACAAALPTVIDGHHMVRCHHAGEAA